ncbi:MAG: hypothetical protein GF311_23005, partial [Candidatus Lokiarchaeota archaeon]|nr:hypothetical protein [Candidatus Lokiarchaeota archaeon]
MEQKKIKLSIVILTIFLINLLIPTTYVKAWEIDDDGYVNYIVDGDTFDVTSVGRIRLADINCPELGDPGADEATQFLTSLIYNKDVFIDIDDIYGTGPYGRIIAVVYVYYDDNYFQNINQALLDAGHAVITDYDNEFNPYTWDILVEYDSGAPMWDPVPNDQNWELSTSYSYDVDATDPSGISEYWINDTENFQINNNGLISNK